MKTILSRTMLRLLFITSSALPLACASPGVGAQGSNLEGAGETCVVDADCAPDLECEHGACAPHGGRAGDDDNGDDGDDAGDDHGGQTGHDDGDAGDDHGGQTGHDDGDAGDDHGGQDGDDDGGVDDDSGSGVACSVDTDCASVEECDDGFCKAHGGGGHDDQ